jgi:EAL domain-containing protein (putative c-di-GMP-specific phosphodiesterase class I)
MAESTTRVRAFAAIQLGKSIPAALPGVDIRNISIHETSGDLVWASEDLPGPEDHQLLLDALDSLALEPLRNVVERVVDADRCKLIYPIRDPNGVNRGAVMFEVMRRTLGGSAVEKAMQPAFSAVLRRLAMCLPQMQAHVIELAPHKMLGQSLTLYVQQLLRLRSGGRTRRYEVLLRSTANGNPSVEAPREVLARADAEEARGELDQRVVGELCGWMIEHREDLEREPATFSVNLSVGALRDPQFVDYATELLGKARVNPRWLGFELREELCRRFPADAKRLVQQAEQAGCQIVLDDFTFHSEVLPLLRYRAVRLLKIDARLVALALTDKVAQAQVAAIAQASKVLGTHSVAKRIESAVVRQWLTAIGVDFAQGFLLEGPQPLTELSSLKLRSVVSPYRAS